MSDVATRVARGAAWLDEKYPNWVGAIDLGTLAVSSCYACVLGQVYTGAIAPAERSEIIAQIVAGMSKSWGQSWLKMYNEGALGGYNVLREWHYMDFASQFGFAIASSEDQSEDDDKVEYTALTDEWTRVIIERRIQAHPDVLEMTCRLDAVRVPATVS